MGFPLPVVGERGGVRGTWDDHRCPHPGPLPRDRRNAQCRGGEGTLVAAIEPLLGCNLGNTRERLRGSVALPVTLDAKVINRKPY